MRVVNVLPDGTQVVSVASGNDDGDPARFSDTDYYALPPGEKSKAVPLGSYPAAPMRFVRIKGTSAAGFVPFGVETNINFAHGNIYIGNGANPEIRVVPADGSMSRNISLQFPAVPVTPEEANALVEYRLSQQTDPAGLKATEAFYNYYKAPRTKPFFMRMMVDETGNLWLSEYYYRTSHAVTSPESTVRWTVVDSAGRPVAGVTFPPRFSPSFIAAERILGVSYDEDGTGSPVVLRIVRQGEH
jgi:hypothetical protein